MEQAKIAALLEKYWQAEATVEEEKQLADYFRQPAIPPEWEPWRNVFAYFEAEGQVTPGKDFEDKLLERIHRMETTGAGLPISRTLPTGSAPVLSLSRRAPWWAAAAVIVLAFGISRLGDRPGQTATSASSVTLSTAIKDTYDDPQLALAAIQRALHTASAKMNQGTTMAQKQIDRMNGGWQSALNN